MIDNLPEGSEERIALENQALPVSLSMIRGLPPECYVYVQMEAIHRLELSYLERCPDESVSIGEVRLCERLNAAKPHSGCYCVGSRAQAKV